MDDLQADICDVLIDTCYAYDTSGYIESLAKNEVVELKENDQKILDILLSCVGIAAAQYVIYKRYGSGSKQFSNEVLERLRSRLGKAGLPDEALKIQLELIENSFTVLKSKFTDVNEYTAIDLTTLLLEPLLEKFDNINMQSPPLHLWLFIFVGDAAQISMIILDNAEKKYNFTP